MPLVTTSGFDRSFARTTETVSDAMATSVPTESGIRLRSTTARRGRGGRRGYPPSMARDPAPEDVRRRAEERKAAREARDWDEADRLKAEIEAAGWKVVDGP